MNPKILVLDEPTAGLDPRGKKEILSLVSSLNKNQGITVVMVSHDMNEVYENANRIIVFKNGEIVYDKSPRFIQNGRRNCFDELGNSSYG